MSSRTNLHFAASALHLGGATAAIVGLFEIHGHYYPTTYLLRTDWLHSDGTQQCTTLDDGGCTAVTRIAQHTVQINVLAALLVFFSVSFVCELLYALKRVDPTLWRWLEYSISASTQFAAIQTLSNVTSLETVLLGSFLVAVLQLVGYGLELDFQTTGDPHPDADAGAGARAYLNVQTGAGAGTRRRAVPAQRMVLLVSGFAILVAAWIAPSYHFSQADPPAFVYVIFWGSAFSWLAFGVVMTLRVTGLIGAAQADLAYTVLSILSKLVVGVVYLAGAWMRDGKLEMGTAC